MKNIAFKGDSERGNQIIQLLKYGGGKTTLLEGTNPNLYYYIQPCGLIGCTHKYMLKGYLFLKINDFPVIINESCNLGKSKVKVCFKYEYSN